MITDFAEPVVAIRILVSYEDNIKDWDYFVQRMDEHKKALGFEYSRYKQGSEISDMCSRTCCYNVYMGRFSASTFERSKRMLKSEEVRTRSYYIEFWKVKKRYYRNVMTGKEKFLLFNRS